MRKPAGRRAGRILLILYHPQTWPKPRWPGFRSRRLIRAFEAEHPMDVPVALSWVTSSPDVKHLAQACVDGHTGPSYLHLWDLQPGKMERALIPRMWSRDLIDDSACHTAERIHASCRGPYSEVTRGRVSPTPLRLP